MNLRNFPSASDRRKALEQNLGISLSGIGKHGVDESAVSRKNCENMIGAVQIPLGVAGPLRITSHGKDYILPLATTEGALVASINRGCKAITAAGGAEVDHIKIGATRGPAFRVTDLRESERLHAYLQTNFSELTEIAQKTSKHLKLVKYMTRGVGRYRYVRFVFDTSDAMGMNMVTIATDALVTHLEQATGVRCIAVAGNFDIDKKPAWLNIIENRGTKVWAEAVIPAAVLSEVLKTTAASLYEVWLSKCMIGSAVAGSMAFNAQFANVIAAIFLATGQDPGHIGEASCGITVAEIVNGTDIYMSVTLPDLMVGTVGGGTSLTTQKEALSILGCTTTQFAEVIGAGVLAGELSLLSSLSQGSLATAHKRLGRGESV